MSAVFEVTDANFEKEVLQQEGKVIVDFWAPWCGPCKQLLPIIEDFAKENEGKIKVCKINVDDSPEIASKMQVRGIPTIILFENGEKGDVKVGVQSKEDLAAWAFGGTES